MISIRSIPVAGHGIDVGAARRTPPRAGPVPRIIKPELTTCSAGCSSGSIFQFVMANERAACLRFFHDRLRAGPIERTQWLRPEAALRLPSPTARAVALRMGLETAPKPPVGSVGGCAPNWRVGNPIGPPSGLKIPGSVYPHPQRARDASGLALTAALV